MDWLSYEKTSIDRRFCGPRHVWLRQCRKTHWVKLLNELTSRGDPQSQNSIQQVSIMTTVQRKTKKGFFCDHSTAQKSTWRPMTLEQVTYPLVFGVTMSPSFRPFRFRIASIKCDPHRHKMVSRNCSCWFTTHLFLNYDGLDVINYKHV